MKISSDKVNPIEMICLLEVKNLTGKKEKKEFGTGFFIAKDKIVTAYHVVENAVISDEGINKVKSGFDINVHIRDYSLNKVNSLNIKEIYLCDEENEISILCLDGEVVMDNYFEFIDFPIYNTMQLGSYIQVKTYGFAGDKLHAKPYDGYIRDFFENYNKVYVSLDGIGGDVDFGGLSGAPLLVKGKVYGIIYLQAEPDMAVHICAIRTSKFKNLLSENGIKVKEFDDNNCFDKNEYKEKLLHEVEEKIGEMIFINEDMKKTVKLAASHVIKQMNCMTVNEFESIIKAILLPFDKEFILDPNFKRYVQSISQIVLQTALLKYAFYGTHNIEFNFHQGKAISFEKNKHISYIYLENSSYIITMIQLFKHFKNDPKKSLEGVQCVIVGSSMCNAGMCKSACTEPITGAKVDFDQIISNISEPFDEKRDELMDIKDDFSKLKFHCNNCLNCDMLRSLDESKKIIKRVLGGVINE